MQDDLARIWSGARSDLRASVVEPNFEVYLDPLQALALDGGCLYISAPDRVRAWVERRYAPLILAALRRHAPSVRRVALVEPGRATGSPSPAGPPAPTLKLNPKYTFDQFVIGPGNRFAHSAALNVAESPAQAWNPLFIYGPPGLGKTHLLGSIAHYVSAHGAGLAVRYTTAECFTNEFVAAIQHGDADRFKDRYRRADVLLIDDVQTLQHKRRTEEEFFHTFNVLYESGSQLVLSSDRPPQEMSSLEQRLRDRFEWGLTTDIEPPDIETRVAILRKRAAYDRVEINDPAVFDLIAGAVTTNVRLLEGALIRVVAFASLSGRRPDAELATEVLRNLPHAQRNNPPSAEKIQEAVSKFYGIGREDLLTPRRIPGLVQPRQVAMYLTRELTSLSLPQIGKAFGGRNHSTVLYAVRKVANRVHSDPATNDAIHRITTLIHKSLAGTIADRQC